MKETCLALQYKSQTGYEINAQGLLPLRNEGGEKKRLKEVIVAAHQKKISSYRKKVGGRRKVFLGEMGGGEKEDECVHGPSPKTYVTYQQKLQGKGVKFPPWWQKGGGKKVKRYGDHCGAKERLKPRSPPENRAAKEKKGVRPGC